MWDPTSRQKENEHKSTDNQGSIPTTPEEFENRGITLKTNQMFSVGGI